VFFATVDAMNRIIAIVGFAASCTLLASLAPAQQLLHPAPAARASLDADRVSVPQVKGWYRMPALHGDTVVFVSEGDLWSASVSQAAQGAGTIATRLTTGDGIEELPAISPDGTQLAFVGTYEGSPEIYTMPIFGGLPTRRTWDGNSAGRLNFVGWRDNDTILWSSGAGTTIPRSRTHMLNIRSGSRTTIPLDQADDAEFITGPAESPAELIFTRLPMQGSHTDRYKGGTAQNLWKFTLPQQDSGAWTKGAEATPLTADYTGTSKRPHRWNSPSGLRVVFTTDRDGRMNLWSMKPDGSDLQQHTKHADMDIGMTTLHDNKAVYQYGPDLYVTDLAAKTDSKLTISLASDLDQTRERWVQNPMSAASSTALSFTGDKVAITARGRVFVFPVKQGRVVEADTRDAIRYRDARFTPDGKNLLVFSDESGELELTSIPSNGIGLPTRLTTDGQTVRWQSRPSPDGKRIAHTDKLNRLWVYDIASATNTLVEENQVDNLDWLSWSPDSQWLAYVAPAGNQYQQIRLYNANTNVNLTATTDRYDSYAPAWSKDGKWLYFLSDRTFRSVVGSPWGPRAPEPFLDKPTRIYQLALTKGQRSPFVPDDEVFAATKDEKKEDKKETPKADAPVANATAEVSAAQPAEGDKKPEDKKDEKKKDEVTVTIDSDGLAERLDVLPVSAGNYTNLLAGENTLYWQSFEASDRDSTTLRVLKITNQKPEAKTVVSGIRTAELSGDRKKLLIQSGDNLHVIDAGDGEAKLDDKSQVDISGWALSFNPRDEWRQMFIDSWRLLRDYFYDRNMHGVDWRGVLNKYLPLVERVRERRELADLLSMMTGELSALHHFVNGGDLRGPDDSIGFGFLGADMQVTSEGWQVRRVYEADPDEPQLRSPLTESHININPGDTILAINGVSVKDTPNPSSLLRNTAGKQVLLRVKPAPIAGADAPAERDVILRPMTSGDESNLRYRSWQVERRRLVDEWSNGEIGYVHLRAMGNENFSEFARDFYPVYTRKGLIIDVRDNRGGNIDSWLLSRLNRKAWMFWNQHAGRAPSWNMQYAFRGHMVTLINERTASDGEAFSEGFRRLGLGKLIGTRTWGGMIWLTSSNTMADGGLASAGEFGVFDAKGNWLIEGHGVEPDIVVDNPPHETFLGEDRQLRAAVDHLKKLIAEQPVDVPPVPKGPDKSLRR
jgi:tricorn protease